jgi:hypothetical protein
MQKSRFSELKEKLGVKEVIPIDRKDIFRAIEFERERQDKKHPLPTLKKSPNEDVEVMHNFIATTEFFSVLIEEVGEVARALQGESDLAEELCHVASVCVRWLENLK